MLRTMSASHDRRARYIRRRSKHRTGTGLTSTSARPPWAIPKPPKSEANGPATAKAPKTTATVASALKTMSSHGRARSAWIHPEAKAATSEPTTSATSRPSSAASHRWMRNADNRSWRSTRGTPLLRQNRLICPRMPSITRSAPRLLGFAAFNSIPLRLPDTVQHGIHTGRNLPPHARGVGKFHPTRRGDRVIPPTRSTDRRGEITVQVAPVLQAREERIDRAIAHKFQTRLPHPRGDLIPVPIILGDQRQQARIENAAQQSRTSITGPIRRLPHRSTLYHMSHVSQGFDILVRHAHRHRRLGGIDSVHLMPQRFTRVTTSSTRRGSAPGRDPYAPAQP